MTLWPRIVDRYKQMVEEGVDPREALNDVLRLTFENWDRIRKEENADVDKADAFIEGRLDELGIKR